MFDRLDRAVQWVAVTCAVLGGFGLIAATLITCVSILLKLARRGMEAIDWTPETLSWVHSVLGEEELVQYSVGFALFAALPYVMYSKGHIKVDLFAGVFGTRVNRLLDLLGDVMLLILACLLLTRQWTLLFSAARRDDHAWIIEFISGNWFELASRLRDQQESQILGIKLWPTYLTAEIFVALFALVALFCVIRSARALGEL